MAGNRVDRILNLDPPTRVKVPRMCEATLSGLRQKHSIGHVLKALSEEPRPILDGARQDAGEDEIERCGELPVVLSIVNDEVYIRRNAMNSSIFIGKRFVVFT